MKSTRAPALKASIPKVTQESSGNLIKPPLIAPAINEKVLAKWKERFEILLKQTYTVEEGEQNR